jgi:DNA-directed RNA polymerase specialized sigma24 family protein
MDMFFGALPYADEAILEQIPDPEVDVEAEALLAVEAEQVRREVKALPEPQRQIVEMNFGLNGFGRALSVREIAVVVGMSKSSVARRKDEGLELLRRSYGITEKGAA